MKKNRLLLFALLLFSSCSNILYNYTPGQNHEDSRGNFTSWTIMVYANGDNNLEQYILSDLIEMEMAKLNIDVIRVIVLIDRIPGYTAALNDWTDTRLFEIRYNNDINQIGSIELSSLELGLSIGKNEDLNMGSRETLENFVDYCKNEFPSEHYALIIQDHGDGWFSKAESRAISSDTTSFNSCIGTNELSIALNNKDLDIISLDACLMGGIEVVYELQDCCEYVIASPCSIPADGYNYTHLLESLNNNISTVEVFAKSFVNSFNEVNKNYSSKMFSYDVRGITSVINNEFNTFISYLSTRNVTEIEKAYNSSSFYLYENSRVYINLLDFANKIGQPQFSAELGKYIYSDNLSYKSISIFMPDYISNFDNNYLTSIKLSKEKDWAEWLEAYLEIVTPADIYEPENNTTDDCITISTISNEVSLILTSGDMDYYRIFLDSAKTVKVELTNIPTINNYSFIIVKKDIFGGDILISADGDKNGKGEFESSIVLLSPGEYFVKVFGRDLSDYSTTESYCLSISS